MDHLPSAVIFDHHRIAMMTEALDSGNYYWIQVQSRSLDCVDVALKDQLQAPLTSSRLSENTD